jgi:hypothetical protein
VTALQPPPKVSLIQTRLLPKATRSASATAPALRLVPANGA